MKYLIAILLPDDIAKDMSAIQQKYNNGRWNIALPPHITLVPPMVIDKSLEEISAIVKQSVENCKPFEVDLKNVEYFAHKYYVIYQSVNITPELENLAGNLNDACQKIAIKIKKYDKFVAHVTLSNDLDKNEFIKRFPQIKKEIAERSFVCHQIALLSRDPNKDKWEIEDIFELK